MNKKKVIVVGGGAAGMMAACSVSCNLAFTELIEQNEKLGKKVYITGKGRCNLTNAADEDGILGNIVTNPKFMYSSLSNFDNKETIEYFESIGLRTKVERGERVFPVSDKSSSVIKVLEEELKKKNVKVRLNTEVVDLITDEGIVKGVKVRSTKENSRIENIDCDVVIFATGGVSYPSTGATGTGLKILESYGHTVKQLRPALVPMNSGDEWIKQVQGLSLKNVKGSFYLKGTGKKKFDKPIYEEFGEMLFTHFGVSGPIVLSASSKVGKYFYDKKIENSNMVLSIDLKPALSKEQLDNRIVREFEKYVNKDFCNSLDEVLPKSLIPVVITKSGIPERKKVNEITREERERLVDTIKGLDVNIASLRSFNEAIITSGGISVKEINPKTMESKIIKGLYIAGEMIDVDALTGGYNLQVAWSTGRSAGENCTAEDK